MSQPKQRCPPPPPQRKPLVTAQTLRQAKTAFRKNNTAHGVSDSEVRQLQRALELEARAEQIREGERRRRDALKRRKEKEIKEREMRRRQTGMGFATQAVGYSHSQRDMKRGMEMFLGLKKRDGGVDVSGVAEEEKEEEDELPEIVVDDGEQFDLEAELQLMSELEKSFTSDFDEHILADSVSRGEDTQELQEPCMTEEQSKDPWDEDDLDEATLLDIARVRSQEAGRPDITKATLAMPLGMGQDHNIVGAIQDDQSPPKPSNSGERIEQHTKDVTTSWPPQHQKKSPSIKLIAPGFNKASHHGSLRPATTAPRLTPEDHGDSWDEFLTSGTQIAREISDGAALVAPSHSSVGQTLLHKPTTRPTESKLAVPITSGKTSSIGSMAPPPLPANFSLNTATLARPMKSAQSGLSQSKLISTPKPSDDTTSIARSSDKKASHLSTLSAGGDGNHSKRHSLETSMQNTIVSDLGLSSQEITNFLDDDLVFSSQESRDIRHLGSQDDEFFDLLIATGL